MCVGVLLLVTTCSVVSSYASLFFSSNGTLIAVLLLFEFVKAYVLILFFDFRIFRFVNSIIVVFFFSQPLKYFSLAV